MASTRCFRKEGRAVEERKAFYHKKLAAGRRIEVEADALEGSGLARTRLVERDEMIDST